MIVSRSEYGSYRYDGDADMKVLRKRADAAVRYFRTRDRKLETIIFGCPVSVIENGRLVDKEDAYIGNNIIRCLSYHESGLYAGRMTFSYNDSYNDGRGQGGCGSIIIDEVTDVRIENGSLVVEGFDGLGKRKDPVSFRYRIQDLPDTKPFTSPIPKGGKVPEPKPMVAATGAPRTKAAPKPAPRKQEPKPAPKKGSKGIGDVTPLDYGGSRLSIDEIASAFSSPVRCRFLNKGMTVWVSMRYPANGLPKWVDVEAYRMVNGEKRYGMGTYPASGVESDGTYLKIRDNGSALWYRMEESSIRPAGNVSASVSELASKLHSIAESMEADGIWISHEGRRMPVYTAREILRMLGNPSGCDEICDMYLECELSHYSEHWTRWSRYGITYEEWKGIERRLREMDRGYGAKPSPKPRSKPIRKTAPTKPVEEKPSPKPKGAPATKKTAKKGTTVYEVRVDGRVEGEFSSKSKAEALKRRLKAEGSKARIHAVIA